MAALRSYLCGHLSLALALAGLLVSSGCQAYLTADSTFPATPLEPLPESEVPRELAKVSLPPYVIEPPDVLRIEVLKAAPKPPHVIDTFDVLSVQATNTLLDQPIFGPVQVGPDGRIDLGLAYGMVEVVGMTIDEAKTAVLRHLEQILVEPEVSISLISSAGAQQITGPHLVQPDGTVNLGKYGSVFVAGLTLEQARRAIEVQLALRLDAPQVIVDVLQYNSKVFYMITQGGGLGDSVQRIPVTGNETVIDAVAQIGGISQLSSKRIWISRPAPNGVGCEQILPVDWVDITRGAQTATNYQLMPGDRLFIAQDDLVAFDAFIGKITRPFERMFGFTILGSQLINRIRNVGQNQNQFF